MSQLYNLVSSTIANYSDEIADNFTNHNAVLRWIKKSGNIETFSGGHTIYQGLRYAGNANAKSYSGADTFTVAEPEVLESAQFPVAQYGAPLSITGRTEFLNAGSERKHDLVKQIIQASEDSLNNLMNQHVWGDGTGNSGKDLLGLEAAVSTDPTTLGIYGGLDASSLTWWKNSVYAPSGTGVTDKDNVQAQFRTLLYTVERGMDRPNVIFAETALYDIFVNSLTQIQRITKEDTASAGFAEVEFQGIPVVREDITSGITANTAYFLNTKYLMWRPHKNRNFVALDDVRSANADVTNKLLVWMGNLTCSNRARQGVFTADVTT